MKLKRQSERGDESDGLNEAEERNQREGMNPMV
jgi:hypothetical protein